MIIPEGIFPALFIRLKVLYVHSVVVGAWSPSLKKTDLSFPSLHCVQS